MEGQPVSFKLSRVWANFWTAPKVTIEASDQQHYHIFHKQIGCTGEIIGLRQNGVSILRLKLKDRGIQQTIEVRTCTKPWETKATMVFGGFKPKTLELPTFQLEMPVQSKNHVRRIKNEAFCATMDLDKCEITVQPDFLDIAEELLLLSYWIWIAWEYSSS